MPKNVLYSEKVISTGLLILRVGIGLAFVAHGYPKVFSGGAEHLAGALGKAGIPGGITAAYLAGLAEFLGGLAVLGGVFFRPVSLILAFNMVVALAFHLLLGDPFLKYSHALESMVLFIALAFTGPGKYSVDFLWFRRSEGSKGTVGSFLCAPGSPQSAETY